VDWLSDSSSSSWERARRREGVGRMSSVGGWLVGPSVWRIVGDVVGDEECPRGEVGGWIVSDCMFTVARPVCQKASRQGSS